MEGIFKVSKDNDRAKDIFEMAIERRELLDLYPKNKAYKIVEEYYEIIKELMTSLLYIEGYKTLSHIKLIDFVGKHYDLDAKEISFIHKLRKFRNNSMYYGKRVSKDFLINNEERIKEIVLDLTELIKEKL
jgi:hypothetical protein